MSFEKDKNQFLKKMDKSVKGEIDAKIKGLAHEINKNENYYTTSSCAGRIVLLENKGTTKKIDNKWLFVSHDKISLDQIKKAQLINEVWLRQEPVIMHVRCKTIEDANKLMTAAKKAGLKDTGIISTKKITVEIKGKEIMTTPIFIKKPLIDEQYLKILIVEANKRLNITQDRIKKLNEEIKKWDIKN